MISLFFSHNQTLEPMSPVGMAETSTDKRLTAFASLAALWVETWQGQVKALRVQVHIALYDSMALKKRKSRAWEGGAERALPEADSCRFTQAVGWRRGPAGPSPESPESFPPAWCLTVYFLSPFFLLSFPSNGAHLEVRVCVPGTGISFQFSWAPSEQRAWHKSHIACFMMWALCMCFLWNELRCSNSFQIAAKEKWPPCPSLESQHIPGDTARLPGRLENLQRRQAASALVFSKLRISLLQGGPDLTNKKRTQKLAPPTFRFICKVKWCFNTAITLALHPVQRTKKKKKH